MKVAIFLIIAIAVNIIGYCGAFVAGFHIGKGKKTEEVQKPLKIEYTRHDMKCWRAQKRIALEDAEYLEKYIVKDFAKDFEDIIKAHMAIEKDYARHEALYCVEMWID